MSAVVLLAVAVVLAAAGFGHLRAPGPAPLLGLAELLVAVALLVLPARIGGALAAVVFAAFTVAHMRDHQAGRRGCDCLGAGMTDDVAPQRLAALTAVAALAGLAAALTGGPSPLGVATGHPARLAVCVPAGFAVAAVWWMLFAGRLLGGGGRSGAGRFALLAPARSGGRSETIVRASAGFVERRLGRRSVLQDMAIVGSALAVAPLRYLLYPGTAMAAILSPSDCSSGLCTDGYTEFCCQITPGGVNTCPADTFPGGWWMCTDYAGRRLCSEEGVRYYVDCNALPGQEFPGGCHCGQNTCEHRRVACNIFRYGQCNTHVPGVTAVVCRLVMCENPSRVPGLHCSSARAVDDAVCGQDAPCLEPRARQLAGAGGV